MPTIIQRFPVKPAMDAEPLVRLILQADIELSADHSIQSVAGPMRIAIRRPPSIILVGTRDIFRRAQARR